MSLVHTRPSLLSRIEAERRGAITLPAGHSGVRKPTVQSFRERYRGTEFETPRTPVAASEPLVSRGRLLVLVSGVATAVMLVVTLGAALP